MSPAAPSIVSLLGRKTSELAHLGEFDVAVVGGGSAGCAAAIAAARAGASVIVIERSGRLGGIGTSVLDTFYGFYTPGENIKVVGGIGDEVVDSLVSQGAAYIRPNTYGAGGGVTYNPEVLLGVWDRIVSESGARIRFHTTVIDVLTDSDSHVTGLLIASKQGIEVVSAKVVVDASGDADIVAFAGGGFDAPSNGHAVQALTTTFRVANVDDELARSFPKEQLFAAMDTAAESGGYRLPRREGSIHRTPVAGVSLANMTRVEGIDPTDVDALSAAEIEGRAQAAEYVRFLRDLVPGYANSELVGLSMSVGVREGRRIHGDYTLTADDVLGAQKFADGIARCGAPIEDHSGGVDTVWKYIPNSGTYDIPFRSLLPIGLGNVVVAGRCLSATHEAHASARSIGQCIAMGQAAGTAAAIAARDGVDLRGIHVQDLRAVLSSAGAVLE